MKHPTNTPKDYIYCKDYKEFVDFWKYDSIEDTSHEGCSYRFVTKKELKNCVNSCKAEKCFEEEIR